MVTAPFADPIGAKGFWTAVTRAPSHRIRQISITLPTWPVFEAPLRVLFVSDLHLGSHAGDIARLRGILDEARELKPDLACFGGDYMNMMFFGGGRIGPETIAAILGQVEAPLGRFAILGNHDEDYGAAHVETALTNAGITVLCDKVGNVTHEASRVHIAGFSYGSAQSDQIHARIPASEPAILLAHDPAEFLRVPRDRPSLMLCGHTHGGQIWLPLLGPLVNMSRVPLRWSYGHVVDNQRQLYVTSGIGTSGVPLRYGIPPEIALLEVGGTR